MVKRWKLYSTMAVWSMWTWLLTACVGSAPTREVQRVDSLNKAAYALRYQDIAASQALASAAFSEVSFYAQGKAEACSQLAFCAFMRMDYEEAARRYSEVHRLTRNELERLVADIGLMKVCQRTARNKEFYDHRNRALQRMARIREEEELFTDRHGRCRLMYARSEFAIVSATYYYYLQQYEKARICMEEMLPPEEALEADTSQWLYAHYIKGAAALFKPSGEHDGKLRQFDELYLTWQRARQGRVTYFLANSMQGMANLLASPRGYAFFTTHRSHELERLGLPVDTLLPLRMGQVALEEFTRFGDRYQVAGAYVTIGRYLNAHGRYGEALDTLQQALLCLGDSVARSRVPDCLSRISEQLSVTYAGLGMKQASDTYRNLYLDIMDRTRQDKELESRYEALAGESAKLNVLLAAVPLGIVLVVLFFVLFNRRSKQKSREHLHKLHQLLALCRNLTTSIPTEAHDTDEVVEALLRVNRPLLKALFGTEEVYVEQKALHFTTRPDRERMAMWQVINPYVQWAIDNGQTSVLLEEERVRLEKQRALHELHIAENKRENVAKRACLAVVNGIQPFIDRILNEVHKLLAKGEEEAPEVRAGKLQYIDELATAIDEHNEILARWVKMKQGSLSLHIETFALSELFDLLRKGSRAFEMKQQQLTVEPTELVVKADKALTLFMVNTLAENARKYIPRGGHVRIEAVQVEQGVEVSVTDDGPGLSPQDVACLNGEKVYDSRKIGMETASDPEALRRHKGSGFGLMNCKGIMEKYRKTSPLFRECVFGVESSLGKGCRFFFRLPAGVRRTWMLIGFLVSALQGVATPTPTVEPAECLLDTASHYADMAYYSNIDGCYDAALLYADSAISYLNRHRAWMGEEELPQMTLVGEGSAAELAWWDAPFDSDFHIILDVRNEAAVAFLAKKEWEAYQYNNRAYTTLYKLLGEDRSLEAYCHQLERSTENKTVAVLMAILLLVLLPVGYYVLYFRKRLQARWNLEQVLEINRRLYEASQVSLPGEADGMEGSLPAEEELLHDLPRRMVAATFDAVNELLPLQRLGVAFYHEAHRRLEDASWPAPAATDETPAPWVQRCFEQQQRQEEGGRMAFPLRVEAPQQTHCIGVLHLELRDDYRFQEADCLLLELVADYWAAVLYNTVVKLACKCRDIETAQDEARRASWEESMLHVQNMVLDNCLSAIKHETVYYPNRIKQLVTRLRNEAVPSVAYRDTLVTIDELATYYKGIFTLLSACAARQLEAVTFRRSVVKAEELLHDAKRYFAKRCGVGGLTLRIAVQGEANLAVTGDVHLLRFLLENLLDAAMAHPLPGELSLTAVADEEGFVRFCCSDPRITWPQAVLDTLFHPSLERIKADEASKHQGTEYLMCKQIVREHDELAGRRGCRIHAETSAAGGFSIWFTMPRKE